MGLFSAFKRPAPPPAEACEPALEPAPMPSPSHDYARGPRASRVVGACLRPFERLFDRLLGPELNPVYRSGTLAVLFLLLATASGLYLLLVYKLSDPYGSVARLQSDLWAGRWLRAWHRYCADAALVATAVHLLRMLAEGKTWGPRALAWVSGVLLAGMLGLCAWTGFVLVWDGQALALARAGARAADLLPVFAEPLSRAFHGAAPPPPSFFFMNLFLHVAAPLGLVFVLWLHTSRLSKSAWLPERRGLWLWGAALLALAVVLPVGLGGRADTQALGVRYPLDPWYNAWVPASLALAPAWTLIAAPALAFLAALVPWLWRPAPTKRPMPSFNDEARCQGCVTCVHDCPFEAISMIPRSSGTGSAMVARVDPSLCVSCGLCVASCDRLSIGPPDRIGTRQMALAQGLGRDEAGEAVVLISCRSGGLGAALAARAAEAGLRVVPWEIDCAGDLHPFSVHALQSRFRGVCITACAPAACQMRHGAELAKRRFLDLQEPADKAGLDAARLRLLQRPSAEADAAWQDLRGFADRLGLLPPADPGEAPAGRAAQWAAPTRALRTLAMMLPFTAVLALLAAIPTGRVEDGAALRLGWRLAGQAVRHCHDLTPEELAARPAHMRRKTECETKRLPYRLQVRLDGVLRVDRRDEPRGVHGDSPLNVDLELPLDPGPHQVELSYLPDDIDLGQGQRLRYEGAWTAAVGRAALVALDEDGKGLQLLP